ncbi:MAG: hypothetical protein D6730_03810 [Bacteroidetes bacterium]|nr:MAG: hypothetical protein D6730_03810 [Bacteroidota bacterium]
MNYHKILKTMKIRALLLVLIFGLSTQAFSQEIDVTQLLADTKTFIFDDNKSTVKTYIYTELEAKTACCGSDRIYLEVKIDPSGYVLQAKTLTGKNDCFKQSAVDIVKNVKWNTKDFKGPKSVYFEIKPNIECGDRTNSYVQLPVFNNKLLDEKGNRLYAESTPSRGNTSPPTAEEPAQEKTETPAAKEAEETPTPPVAERPAPTANKPTEAPKASGEQPAVVASKPEPTPKTQEQPQQPTAAEPVTEEVTSDEQLEKAKLLADNYRDVQEAEINLLKEQLEQKKAEREAEIKRQQELEAERQRKIAAREERRRRLMERRQQEQQAKESNEDFDLFAEENSGDDDDDDDDQQKPEEDRLQTELERLRQERQRIEEERRRIEDQQRQAMSESERQSRDLLKIEEEILRLEEEMQRKREQRELDRIAEERRQLEEQKRQREDELQRVMDEIQRLRDEADQKMAELERQEQDLQRIGQEQTLREQEIEAERIRREQAQILELKRKEMEILANQNLSAPESGTSALIEQALANPDSNDRYLDLVRTVALLEAELKRLQNQIEVLTGGEAASTLTPTPGVSTPTVTPRTSTATASTEVSIPPDAGKRATEDDSWKNLDYKDPNAPPEIYRSAPKPAPVQPTEGEGVTRSEDAGAAEGGQTPGAQQTPQQKDPKAEVPPYRPGRGYSPHPSHKDTYANVPGPKFTHLDYGDGFDAMKRFITDKLKDGGVCGLAQMFAEVTVAPNGKVVGYKVLKANSALVMALAPPILQSLEFKPTNLKLNEVSYIEFKADIVCDGERIDLKKVKPYVKDKPETEGNN